MSELEKKLKESFQKLGNKELTMVQRNAEELKLTSYLHELYETKDSNKIETYITKFQEYLDTYRGG